MESLIVTMVELTSVGGEVTGHLRIRLERAHRSELAAHAVDESRALVDENLPTSKPSAVDGIETMGVPARSDLASGLKTIVDKLDIVVILVDKAAKVCRLPEA